MKIFSTVLKILTALAAVAGAIYVIATYGDKIVAWAKNLLNCSCCNCNCECDCDGECECECECACECVEEAPAAEEVPAVEEAPAEEVPVAEDADFEA